MAFNFKDNLVAEGLDHLVEQFKNKPKMAAFLGALLQEDQELEDAARGVYFCRWVDNAEGVQLEGLGSIVGEAREGRSDSLYRLAIKAKVQINSSEATPEDVYTAMRNFCDRTYEIIETYPATFILRLREAWLAISDPSVEAFASLLNQVNGAGIEAVFQYSLAGEDNTFTLASGSVPELDTERGLGASPVLIAVANLGTTRTMRSVDDGLTWSPVAAAAVNAWTAVTYGNGVWLAVASSGTNRTMRSTDDGLTWTAVAAPGTGSFWIEVSYGNGVGVGVASSGGAGQPRVMRTTNDGVSWTGVSTPLSYSWYDVKYAEGVWLGAANESVSGTSCIMRSLDDGQTWTQIDLSLIYNWRNLGYGNGVWLAVASPSTDHILRSVDQGLTWTEVSIPTSSNWNDLQYHNGTWLMVSSSGADRVLRSVDEGLTWSTHTAAALNSWRAVTYSNNAWVATASFGTDRVMRSVDDGLTWTGIPVAANQWYAVAVRNSGGRLSNIERVQ